MNRHIRGAMTKYTGTRELLVRDVMTSTVITVDAENTLRDVVNILSTHAVSGAPVLSGDRVVGVISITDILDFLATTPGVPMAHAQDGEWLELEDAGDSDAEASRSFFTDLWEDAGADMAAHRIGSESG